MSHINESHLRDMCRQFSLVLMSHIHESHMSAARLIRDVTDACREFFVTWRDSFILCDVTHLYVSLNPKP